MSLQLRIKKSEHGTCIGSRTQPIHVVRLLTNRQGKGSAREGALRPDKQENVVVYRKTPAQSINKHSVKTNTMHRYDHRGDSKPCMEVVAHQPECRGSVGDHRRVHARSVKKREGPGFFAGLQNSLYSVSRGIGLTSDPVDTWLVCVLCICPHVHRQIAEHAP